MAGARFSNGDAEEHSFLSEQDKRERGIDDLTSLDQKLINYAGALSPNKIAELTGLTADQVAKRTLEVMDSIDYFTAEQLRAKQLIMLNALIADAMNRLPTVSDRNAGAFYNSTGGNIFRALKEYEAIEARASKNSASMEKAYAARMVYIVGRAFDRYLGRLIERYPDEDPQDIAGDFQKTILEIAREIDAES